MKERVLIDCCTVNDSFRLVSLYFMRRHVYTKRPPYEAVSFRIVEIF